MAQTDPGGARGRAVFAAECRACERQLVIVDSGGMGIAASPGVHVRCSTCGQTEWATPTSWESVAGGESP